MKNAAKAVALIALTLLQITHGMSVNQVAAWVDSVGLPAEVTATLKDGCLKNSVDGTILSFITDQDLVEDLHIKSSLHRTKIIAAISKLPKSSFSGKMDFWQYRSMNRKQIDELTTLLVFGAPRFGIAKLANLPEYGQPSTKIGGWAEWILFPHYYIYLNAETIAGGLPGFLPWLIAGNLLGKVSTIVIHTLKQDFKGVAQAVLGSLLAELVVGGFSWIYMNLIWPVIPAFICDFFFYFNFYIGPCITLGIMGIGLIAAIGIGSEKQHQF